MKNAIRLLCLAPAVLLIMFYRHGFGSAVSAAPAVPVQEGEECSRIHLSPLEGVSAIPFRFCTDTAGANDDGALDSHCGKTYEHTCSKGKCQDQGRGKCVPIHDSDRSTGVHVIFDPGTCRRDPDVCKDSKKPLLCVGKIKVPEGKKLQCKCDCTLPVSAMDRGPASRQPHVDESVATSEK